MFRLLNRTFGLLTLVIGAVALIAVLNNVVVYAESAAVDETQQNGPEANLKYLFAVFFLVWVYTVVFTITKLAQMLTHLLLLRGHITFLSL